LRFCAEVTFSNQFKMPNLKLGSFSFNSKFSCKLLNFKTSNHWTFFQNSNLKLKSIQHQSIYSTYSTPIFDRIALKFAASLFLSLTLPIFFTQPQTLLHFDLFIFSRFFQIDSCLDGKQPFNHSVLFYIKVYNVILILAKW
jgi:hypothetical protein